MNIISLAAARKARDTQVRPEFGFELEARVGTVEFRMRAPDGTVMTAFLQPEQAAELGEEFLSMAKDAEVIGG